MTTDVDLSKRRAALDRLRFRYAPYSTERLLLDTCIDLLDVVTALRSRPVDAVSHRDIVFGAPLSPETVVTVQEVKQDAEAEDEEPRPAD